MANQNDITWQQRYTWRNRQAVLAFSLFNESYTLANDRDWVVMWAHLRMASEMRPADRVRLLDGL